jgi:hypothetical protein
MRKSILFSLIAAGAILIGCSGGDPASSRDNSKVAEQPPANLEAGAKAQTIEEWAAANPNNGAPGSGEGTDK